MRTVESFYHVIVVLVVKIYCIINSVYRLPSVAREYFYCRPQDGPTRFHVLDSERSIKCIDFTMKYIFYFFYIMNILLVLSNRNTTSIFNFGIFSGG